MKTIIITCDSEAEIIKGVKRKANIGEYVAILNPDFLCHKNYELGDIVRITEEIETGNVKGVNQKDGVKTGYISKHEYVVLENYQPESEPEQPKEEFKPYLVLEEHNRHYGYIGSETALKDAIGRALRVGDTVELYNDKNHYIGERPICVNSVKKPFVMGIDWSCGANGEITSGWKIILKRRYEDIKHGEKVDGITYMKER